MDSPSTLLLLLAGAALLFAGRRLFWLFVGLVGFFAGLQFAAGFFQDEADGFRWLVAAVCGVFGIFLALVLQKGAVAVAGFFVGGFFVARLLGLDLSPPEPVPVLLFGLGGVMAAVLALWLFDAALIFLSSLAGAGLVVDALDLRQGLEGLVLIGLVVLGIAVQAGWTARGAAPARARTAG